MNTETEELENNEEGGDLDDNCLDSGANEFLKGTHNFAQTTMQADENDEDDLANENVKHRDMIMSFSCYQDTSNN